MGFSELDPTPPHPLSTMGGGGAIHKLQNIHFSTNLQHACLLSFFYSKPGHKIVIFVTCYSLLVTVTLVLERMSNDVTSNNLVLYIYFQVAHYSTAETVSHGNT